MNGYTLMAESYKKLMNEGKIDREQAEKNIRIYEFLGTCDTEDFCMMVDSAAFNDIIKSFLYMAVSTAGLDEDSRNQVQSQLPWIFDEKSSSEVLKNYME